MLIPISQAALLAPGLSQLWLKAWRMIPQEEILKGNLEDYSIVHVDARCMPAN